jgi:hypothetical protein
LSLTSYELARALGASPAKHHDGKFYESLQGWQCLANLGRAYVAILLCGAHAPHFKLRIFDNWFFPTNVVQLVLPVRDTLVGYTGGPFCGQVVKVLTNRPCPEDLGSGRPITGNGRAYFWGL